MSGDYIDFTYSHDGSAAVGDDAAYVILGNGFYKSINFTIEPTIIGVSGSIARIAFAHRV